MKSSPPDHLAHARRVFDTAMIHCADDCRDYHAMRGYLLGLGGLSGWRAGGQEAQADMRRLAEGRPRVFLAGSGDDGLLRFIHASYGGLPLHVTVVDRCSTPLLLCRQYAEANNIPIETITGLLEDYVRPNAYDIVLAHRVFNFLGTRENCDQCIRNWCQSLAPNGVFIGRLSGRGWSRSPTTNASSWKLDIPEGFEFPEPRERFLSRLQSYSEGQRKRPRLIDLSELGALLAHAGLVPHLDTEDNTVTAFRPCA